MSGFMYGFQQRPSASVPVCAPDRSNQVTGQRGAGFDALMIAERKRIQAEDDQAVAWMQHEALERQDVLMTLPVAQADQAARLAQAWAEIEAEEVSPIDVSEWWLNLERSR